MISTICMADYSSLTKSAMHWSESKAVCRVCFSSSLFSSNSSMLSIMDALLLTFYRESFSYDINRSNTFSLLFSYIISDFSRHTANDLIIQFL